MDISIALLLFSFIILLYWVITELFTFFFRLTGLPANTGIMVMLVERGAASPCPPGRTPSSSRATS